jgi:hypothetical protein
MDRGFVELLGHWLAEQRAADRVRQQATEDARLWLRRLRLARESGLARLVDAAAERAGEARDRHERAVLRWQTATRELEALRGARTADRRIFDEAMHRSRQTLASFERLGMVPEGTTERFDPALAPLHAAEAAERDATAPPPTSPGARATALPAALPPRDGEPPAQDALEDWEAFEREAEALAEALLAGDAPEIDPSDRG